NGRDLLSLRNSLQRIAPIQQLIVAAAADVVVTPVVAGVVPVLAGAAHGQPAESADDEKADNNFHGLSSNGNGKRPALKDGHGHNQLGNQENLLGVLSRRMNALPALAA